MLAPQSEPGNPFPTTGSIIAQQTTYWSQAEEGPSDVLHYVVMVDRESRRGDLPAYVLVEYNVCYRDTGSPPTRDYERVVERVEPPVSKAVHTRLRMRLVRDQNCDCPSEGSTSQPDYCGNVFRFTDDVMPIATGHLPCYSLACGDFRVVAEE